MKANRLFAAALLSLAAATAHAQSELQTYVGRCQNELVFTASQVPDTIDCTQGKLFDLSFTTPISDRVVYHRVNDKVDLVAACRWGNSRFRPPPDSAFISMELIIHNRENGGTCFFGAKDVLTGDEGKLRPIPNPIVTPTNFKAVPGEPGKLLADKYWMQPTELNNKKLPTDSAHTPSKYGFVRCVGCHSQGPYIASKAIARDLAGFGLLNDGHDIRTNFLADKHYYVVGSSPHTTDPATDLNTHAFREWNRIIDNNNATSCGGSCHRVAVNSTAGPIFDFQEGNVTRVLPSIAEDIAQYVDSGMPPYDDASEIRWMNLATPWATGIEVESFERAKDSGNGTASATILANCGVPGEAEAIAVGMRRQRQFRDTDGGPPPPPWDDTVFSTTEMKLLPNRLNTFNLKEGLLCLNSEQAPGKTCVNYQTSYLCDDKWTDETLGFWFDTDTPSTSGDHEQRSRVAGLCANPTAMKTRFAQGAAYVVVHGPTDRLALFNKQRLACNNHDQVDGKCSNYVIRYRNCPSGGTLASAASIRSVWSSRLLTASDGSNGVQVRGQPSTPAWNTQRWMVEEEANSTFVRLRNTGTNTYLNVRGQEENAVVETYEIRDWDSQRWIREPIPGGSQVRFRNVWSGRYLTLRDTSDYSAVYSQDWRDWPSQRWTIQ